MRFPASIFLILSLIAVPASAASPDEATARRQLQHWLNDLADDDAQVRETARMQLMGISRGELRMFRDVVAQSRPLLPAQAVALRDIVLQAYASGEPYEPDRREGFLGIELSTVELPVQRPEGLQASGVLVVSRMLGFGAYRMLQDGDIILGVLDRPNARIGEFMDLATIIRSIPPGTAIRIEVYRRGRIITVPITLDARPADLARFENLDAFRSVRFRRAYEYWRNYFAPLIEQGVS